MNLPIRFLNISFDRSYQILNPCQYTKLYILLEFSFSYVFQLLSKKFPYNLITPNPVIDIFHIIHNLKIVGTCEQICALGKLCMWWVVGGGVDYSISTSVK